jgi:hypothetical protein
MSRGIRWALLTLRDAEPTIPLGQVPSHTLHGLGNSFRLLEVGCNL